MHLVTYNGAFYGLDISYIDSFWKYKWPVFFLLRQNLYSYINYPLWIKRDVCMDNVKKIKINKKLSETRCYYVMSLFIGWHLVLRCWHRLLLLQNCKLLKKNENKNDFEWGQLYWKLSLWEENRWFCGRRLCFRIDVKRNLCPPNRRFAFPNDNFEDNDPFKILSETSRRYVI